MIEIKYPKNEHVWVTYYENGEPIKLVTTKNGKLRDAYYLYDVHSDGSITKIGKAVDPVELEKRYFPVRRKKKKET